MATPEDVGETLEHSGTAPQVRGIEISPKHFWWGAPEKIQCLN
jgi:hypothetical protein